MAKKKSGLDALKSGGMDFGEASKKAMEHLENKDFEDSTQSHKDNSTQEQTVKKFKAIRIDERLHKILRKYAFLSDVTMAAYCENLIIKDLVKNGAMTKEQAKELLR